MYAQSRNAQGPPLRPGFGAGGRRRTMRGGIAHERGLGQMGGRRRTMRGGIRAPSKGF